MSNTPGWQSIVFVNEPVFSEPASSSEAVEEELEESKYHDRLTKYVVVCAILLCFIILMIFLFILVAVFLHFLIVPDECLCLNSGECIDDACKCPDSFTGYLCETQTCPCINNGTCNGSFCDCPEGFVGSICERGLCLNGGEWDYKHSDCKCAERYFGKFCEIGECFHNGNWSIKDSKCECPTEYEGDMCERRRCQHGGVWSSKENRCNDCDRGYEGRHCEKPICIDKCFDEGTCIEPDVCKCPRGRDRRCEKVMSQELVSKRNSYPDGLHFCRHLFETGLYTPANDKELNDLSVYLGKYPTNCEFAFVGYRLALDKKWKSMWKPDLYFYGHLSEDDYFREGNDLSSVHLAMSGYENYKITTVPPDIGFDCILCHSTSEKVLTLPQNVKNVEEAMDHCRKNGEGIAMIMGTKFWKEVVDLIGDKKYKYCLMDGILNKEYESYDEMPMNVNPNNFTYTNERTNFNCISYHFKNEAFEATDCSDSNCLVCGRSDTYKSL